MRKDRPIWEICKARLQTFVVGLGVLCALPFSPLSSSILHAQNPTTPPAVRDVSVRFEHLTVADGLSQTTIYDIYQDRFGFMWFATQDGLNRYDGHSMKVYRHVPFDPTGLGDNTIAGITEDSNGYLWIAAGRGLYRMDPGNEHFSAYRRDPDDPGSLASDVIRFVLEDRNRRIWVATDDGLDRLDQTTGRFVHYRHDPSDSSSISHNGISWIFEDHVGSLWITAANGLNRMRADLSGFDHFLTSDVGTGDAAPTDYRIQRLLERPEQPGILWVATNEGLVRLNARTGVAETFMLSPDLDVRRVADLVQDPIARNILWLAVPGAGLGRFDIRTGRFSIYGTDPTDPYGLSTANTERVFVDRSGMLWVGANGVGVDRFNPATVAMTHLRHEPGNPESLPGSHVRGIHQARDGVLWVGTTDREGISRLSRFDPRTRSFRHFEHRSGDFQSLGEGRIRAVLADHSGAVWIGIGGSGLYRLPPGETSRFQHFTHDPGDPTSLSHNVIRYLLEDESGTIWVATNGGLDRLLSSEEGAFAHYRHDPDDLNTLTANWISVLFESRAGFIWVGVTGGLNRLDPLTGRVTHYYHVEADTNSLASDAILSIHERDREPGVIWVGTFGGGLSKLTVSDGSFRHYADQDGLPNNTVYGILEDDQGRLWMSTNFGLSRFDPETDSFRNYGLEIGLQSLEFNSVASHKGPFGEMFFGGVNGLNAFFPEELTENRSPPEVVIVDVKLSHRSVRTTPELLMNRAVPALRDLRLSHDQNDLTFDYVGLHFQNPLQNVYAYRLTGYDDEWIDAGSRRTATYTNLSPGTYTFRVKGANSDGVWSERDSWLHITIAPPWWKTWWAFASYLIVLMGVLVGAYRIQRRRLIKSERERAAIREAELKARALGIENERKTRELEEARELQLSMLPRIVPEHPSLEIEAYMRTATEVGGDYYDFHVSKAGALTIAIGDATGHGARAGTMVTAVKSLFNILAEEEDLASVMSRMTNALRRMNFGKLYMAMALVKVEGNRMRIAGAGMPAALVFRRGLGELEEVSMSGMPLGGFADYPYRVSEIGLDDGDAVLLMSDGLAERFRPDGEMFGYVRARKTFSEFARLSPKATIDRLVQESNRWAGNEVLNDDMTFIVMKVKSETGSSNTNG